MGFSVHDSSVLQNTSWGEEKKRKKRKYHSRRQDSVAFPPFKIQTQYKTWELVTLIEEGGASMPIFRPSSSELSTIAWFLDPPLYTSCQTQKSQCRLLPYEKALKERWRTTTW